MATAATKVRLVRCPKCRNLLTEFADVPVYRCGGCCTVLRAKYRDVNGEKSDLQTYCHEKGESSGTRPNFFEGRSSGNTIAHIETKANYSLNEQEEKSLNLSAQCSESMSSNDSLAPISESLHCNVASDNGSNSSIHDKYRLLSRRTIRHQSSSDSLDARGKDILMSRSSNLCTDVQEREISLDSEGLCSVLSWLESDKNVPSRSLSKNSTFNDDSIKFQNVSAASKLKNLRLESLELLKLVEELDGEISGLYEVKENQKQGSQFGGTQPLRPLLDDHNSRRLQRPNLCCNNRYKCLEKGSSIQHLNTNIPPYCQKFRPTKSYCQPASGGAPFVICYKCLELLQMPVDFLVSTRRSNRLKCGACSETLVLSFPVMDHPLPLAATEAGSSSGDPVLFSEESGAAFFESCSTEDEHMLNLSRNSYEERDGERASTPPLHRLMGYNSAREILY